MIDSAALDALLNQAVDSGAVPGAVAMVGDRDGVLYEGAAGRLSVERDEPVVVDTMFWIASMTKALVSVAALGMIERGELELEQPVAEILPAFGELPVLEGFDGDEPRLRPAARPATIRHLMTHTAGLGYWFSNADALRYHQVTGVPDPFTGKLAMFEMPLLFDPGDRWEYGTNLDWLGRVVEAVSGQDLNTHCGERIFAPLGMTETTFAPTEAQFARAMAIHQSHDGGPLTLSTTALPAEQEFWSAGAGAFSTAGDYLRFLRAMLRDGELDGERVLAPETVELAFTDHLHGAALPAQGTVTAVPELCNDVPALPFRQGFGLGFNLMLEDLPAMRRAGSGNWAGLCNSFFFVDRASGVAHVFMTQLLPFYDTALVPTLPQLEMTIYAGLG